MSGLAAGNRHGHAHRIIRPARTPFDHGVVHQAQSLDMPAPGERAREGRRRAFALDECGLVQVQCSRTVHVTNSLLLVPLIGRLHMLTSTRTRHAAHQQLGRPIGAVLMLHADATCGAQDDYEALATLYPVCSGMAAGPQCHKSDGNIGLLRVTLFFVMPLCVSLIVSVCIHW